MTFNINNLFNMVSTNNTTQETTTASTVSTPAPQNEVPTAAPIVENTTVAPAAETQLPVTETTTESTEVLNEDVKVAITNEPTISIQDLVGAESQQQPLVSSENTVQPIQETPAVIETTDAQLDATFGSQAVETEEQPMTDLFGELSAKADEAEAIREQEVADTQVKKATDSKKTTEKSFDVNLETTIRIGGGAIPLTAYFTPEEITQGIFKKGKGENEGSFEKISPENVRARLEKDYPEFVKGFTTITYHGGKRNFIVAVPVGKTKGNK
ncbi:hypothetical protein [Solibacillus sp. NPDC093137]|uniref:hypothetical protein n=1 Tax=Solibacillus sp. NPDC093137 TaxID=3390678 RepID=UPI003CFC6ADC